MTLAELSIKRPVFAWMMMAGIMLFGAIAFQRLGVSYLPDVDYPVLNISVGWSGAAPEVMEQEIVDPIEERVVMTEGVREVHSNIGPATANITLTFDSGTNINNSLQEVESYLQQIRLPQNVQPPVIHKSNPEDDPIMRVAVYGSHFSKRDIADYVDKNMQIPLQVVPGVGEVAIKGFGQRALRIFIDNDKLTALDLTAEDVETALLNQNLETSSGYIENRQHFYTVRTMGEGISPDQVGDILILSRGGGAIYNSHIHIRDVARVEDGLTDQRSIVRLDGKDAVTLDIKKQRGFNEVQVADNVRAKLEQLQKNMPPGMEAQLVVDYTRFTKKAVDQTEHELLVACILTSVVCFLFLGTWTSSINVLIAIPTSMAGAFLVLYELHFTLNLFTLLALALAIGIVVDDAIMVLENIFRHYEMGKKRRRAALDGSREITPAAVAATVAVVAIFLPVAFMQGVIGYFFFQFGITITVAVLFSLLEAITLTPMRCSRMISPANRANLLVWIVEHSFGWLTRVYRLALGWALRRRFLVLFASAVFFGLSYHGLGLLRHEFVPPQDQNFFHISFEAPLNASIYYTDEKVKLVEDYLKTIPEVDHYLSSTIGHYGNVDVVLMPKRKRTLSQADIVQKCRQILTTSTRFMPLKFWFGDLSGRGLSGGGTAPVAFNITGPDYETISKVTDAVVKRLEDSGKIIDLYTDYREGVPEEEIIPNRAEAAARGVSVDSIANTISIAIGGSPVGKFTSGGHRYDVLVQSDVDQRDSFDDIRRLKVRNNYGELIPMTAVTTMHEVKSVLNESRINRLRVISVTANIADGVSQGDALALAEKVSRELCPSTCQFNFEGSGQSYRDTFSGLWFALILGVAVAYMVLAAQFNSYVHPISVLMALPFSLTGAVLALWMTNQSLNLFSMIGLILLMGIAKKNSILLVEFTNHVRAQDKRPLREALLDACPIRLRPIMMTSVATISSAIPSALGLGPGSETRVPMAIAVIGGVFVSTLFTLFVVPCSYSILANFEPNEPDDDDEDSIPLPMSHDRENPIEIVESVK